MAVAELQKKATVWCAHAVKKCGCRIYDDRPQSCRDFQCLWLASSIAPPHLRPDVIHGLLTEAPNEGDVSGTILHEDPGYPGVAYHALKATFQRAISSGHHYVIVISGHSRQALFYGDAKLLPIAQAAVSAAMPTSVVRLCEQAE